MSGLQRPSVDAASLLRNAPVSDTRFWMIQLLVVAVTLIHAFVEYSETQGELGGFLRAIHNLPVEAYVVPVVLAGWWFGLAGGLLTGLLTLVLSLPNLVLFHRSDFEWLGELGAVAFVIGVGVLVAYMTESEARSRRIAVATSRRLEALHDVTSVLNRYGDPDAMVGAVVDKLSRVDGVQTVRFLPKAGRRIGGVEARRSSPERPGTARATNDTEPAHAVAEVSTPQGVQGALHLSCGHPQPCLEDSGLLSHVAHELAIALENVRMQERERDEIQGYARAMTDAQERERRRIARDLHDGPAQSLVVLVRGLGRLAATPSVDADPSDAGELREVARQALHAIRRTTHALRPALLDDLGLVPAIESLADRHRQRNGATVDLVVTGELRRLSDDVELAAFRIVQEALSNIEHHAAASTAHIGVRYAEHDVEITITDDGPGFERSRLEAHEQFGLMGMNERAEAVGGDVAIESHVGSGTTVTFRAPG